MSSNISTKQKHIEGEDSFKISPAHARRICLGGQLHEDHEMSEDNSHHNTHYSQNFEVAGQPI